MRFILALSTAAVLAGCAVDGGYTASAGSSAPATAEERRVNRDPYPSTYRPYPGVPTLVRNVTIFDGEGGRIDHGSVLFRDGRIAAVGADIPVEEGVTVIDGTGRYLTPGIIDVHSHLGDYPSPGVSAHSDGNEMTSPTTPEVWAEHSVWPQDPGFATALVNGGVTTLQILPGSANLMGGRGVTVKNVYARSVQGMRFPGAPYSLKMACGENPKRVYGSRGRMPSTRMGNIAVDRATFARAVEYRRRWENYERNGGEAPARDLAMETLRGVLDGEIRVQNHCYRADEMAIMMDMAKEFGFHITAFHHAVEAYKIADMLREEDVCAAVWADWWGFKMESYDAIDANLAILESQGACGLIHSDDENGIQRLNQEIAKARAAGIRAGINISEEVAWKWVAINPARVLGIADQTGSIRVGKMADLVLWNGDPFSVYTRPEMVWIDGALLYDMNDPARRPVSDFLLGQPGAEL